MDWFLGSGALLVGVSITYGVSLLFRKGEKNEETSNSDEIGIEYIFTKNGQSTKQKLLRLIDKTRETLDIAIYAITDKEYTYHLCKATDRGVKVRLIADNEQTTTVKSQTDCIKQLISNATEVKTNTHGGRMHLKLMISDMKTIATGSYNYTYSAENRNDEVVVFINNKRLATEWTKRFEGMWNDSKNFIDYNNQNKRKYA